MNTSPQDTESRRSTYSTNMAASDKETTGVKLNVLNISSNRVLNERILHIQMYEYVRNIPHKVVTNCI